MNTEDKFDASFKFTVAVFAYRSSGRVALLFWCVVRREGVVPIAAKVARTAGSQIAFRYSARVLQSDAREKISRSV
jgi:hypothetical protein